MPPQGQNLPADDVIVFCDYSRFRNNFDGVKAAPGVAYDTRTGITTAMSSSFSGCRDQINFDTTAAWTLDNTKAGKVATIQICRWFLQFYTEGQKYRFLVSHSRKYTRLSRALNSLLYLA